jgi:hypothetical protein
MSFELIFASKKMTRRIDLGLVISQFEAYFISKSYQVSQDG